MTQPIKEVIESLDKNIKNLEEAEEINMHDVKVLMLDLLGTMRDLWETLEIILQTAKTLKKMWLVEKGEEIENKKIAQEVKNLYL